MRRCGVCGGRETVRSGKRKECRGSRRTRQAPHPPTTASSCRLLPRLPARGGDKRGENGWRGPGGIPPVRITVTCGDSRRRPKLVGEEASERNRESGSARRRGTGVRTPRIVCHRGPFFLPRIPSLRLLFFTAAATTARCTGGGTGKTGRGTVAGPPGRR